MQPEVYRMTADKRLSTLKNDMQEWRRSLHSHPETGFNLKDTSAFVAEKLSSFGISVTGGIAGTGLVGTLTKGEGQAIGLRADMDALDVHEEEGLPYRSTLPGKMHACGHDGHTAMLLGAAACLAASGNFNGTVRFIFQPAEENEGGGRVMVEDGLFERFPCDSIFSLHNMPMLPAGSFAVKPGAIMGAYDVFEIIIKGAGGHAAMPQLGCDPIVAAAQAIGMFQTIVSRNTNPVEAAVVSVTEVKGGTTYNVIPETVSMRGTTRHFLPQVQDLIEKRMQEILKGLDISLGVNSTFKYERRYPAVVNSDKESAEALKAAIAVAGKDNVFTDLPPIMGSEDFGFMLKVKPGAYIFLGAGDPRPNGMLHQPGYDFNDEILATGAEYWVTLVESLLPAVKL
jgi:amidohydrolase